MVGEVGPVVVGTDFSDTAGVAVVEARRLAALLGTEVIVVHVADGAADPRATGDVPAAGQFAGVAGPAVEGWLQSAGVPAEGLVVRTGSAWVELARFATEVAPSLVVVGSHGQSGYQPLHIGSTASRVSMNARCPVVVVSPRVQDRSEVRMQGQQGTQHAVRAGAAAVARVAPGNQSGTGETR